MKIRELIEELQKHDPEGEVFVMSDAYYECAFLGQAGHVAKYAGWQNNTYPGVKMPGICIVQNPEDIH